MTAMSAYPGYRDAEWTIEEPAPIRPFRIA